jgi:hypothetical protein
MQAAYRRDCARRYQEVVRCAINDAVEVAVEDEVVRSTRRSPGVPLYAILFEAVLVCSQPGLCRPSGSVAV